jgi:hypothetical protein
LIKSASVRNEPAEGAERAGTLTIKIASADEPGYIDGVIASRI